MMDILNLVESGKKYCLGELCGKPGVQKIDIGLTIQAMIGHERGDLLFLVMIYCDGENKHLGLLKLYSEGGNVLCFLIWTQNKQES